VNRLAPVLVAGLIAMAGPAAMAAEQAAPLARRLPAPDFTLPDVEDKTHRLADYRGKVVLLNFWATWCPPCRKEMPSMQRLWEKFRGRDFAILAVDVGEDEERVFAFTLELDIPLEFPLLLDRDGKVMERWPVRGLPTTFILDREGRIAYQAIGGREWDAPELVAIMQGLMAEGGTSDPDQGGRPRP